AKDGTKGAQWRAFVRKNRLKDVPDNFEEVVAAVSTFVKRPAESVVRRHPFKASWTAPGPWR
ncbi:nucleotidyl transferase AbiEii/AbiGii toxin family protein, partial [Acidobacteria bacterium AH-259-G07]|nr:nucleotidyl transferase AbiEii/AbiGii toxin family protein [Acidobacteria bacterium AH-259-G07]